MVLPKGNFIGFKQSAKGDQIFSAFSPATNKFLPGQFMQATDTEFEQAIELARIAFPTYSTLSYLNRAEFLDAIATEIMDLGAQLIERCVAETGLPPARIIGERGRTFGQLQLFAQLLRDGWWVDARIDTAQLQRQPQPKPDLRRMLIPLGPVAVYGASNFPLAFSTAGGDTVSALAAGCPVIVKAHPSHPGTNALISSAIISAAQKTGMPNGVFSSLHLSNEYSIKLIEHPTIKAAGFTGSRKVGMILFNSAVNRDEPIPLYAEMSSVNPVIITESALLNQSKKIAHDLATSVMLGAGQFCTNPGLVLLVESEASNSFVQELAEHIESGTPATMLNKGIYDAYLNDIHVLRARKEISLIATSGSGNSDQHQAQPALHSVKGADFLLHRALMAEIFGPSTVIVTCSDELELLQVLHSLEGQLTATIHCADSGEENLIPIINLIVQKAGRIIYGGYPTGVEVSHAMHHGGPFPSTADGRSSSVGTSAIYRFVRPVAYQDFPDYLLPDALKTTNPLNLLRLVDGKWTKR